MNIFKTYIKWLFLPVLFLSLFVSCKDDDPSVAKLTLSERLLTAESHVIEIEIQSGSNWFLETTGGNWGPSAQSEGSGNSTVKIIVAQNNEFDDRASIVKVTNDAGLAMLTITQKGAILQLTPQEPIIFDMEGTSRTMMISTEKNWKIINSEDAPWCRFSALAGKGASIVRITPLPFDEPVSRGPVDIEFECEGQVMKITISQPYDIISMPVILEPSVNIGEVLSTPVFKWTPSIHSTGSEVKYRVELSSYPNI